MKFLRSTLIVFLFFLSFDIHSQTILNCRNDIVVDDDGYGVEQDQVCFRYPTCGENAVNPDGDNWGEENEAVCIVYQTCSSSAVDLDSEGNLDGWGWENQESCIVNDDVGAQYPNCPLGIVINDEGFGETSEDQNSEQTCFRYPICSSEAVDLDGDGWGRENEAICVVADISELQALYASCSNAVELDDNGMGIENDRVCYRFPTCTTIDSDEDNDNWAIENGEVCVVRQTCSSAEIEVNENGFGTENLESCISPSVRLPNCRNGISLDDNGIGLENDLVCQRYPSCSQDAANWDEDNWGRENDGEVCVQFQTCSSSQVGSSGSPWGWENNESCLVGERYGPAVPACSNGVVVDEIGLGVENGEQCQRYSTCLDESTDTNGDNWGRDEEGNFCVVLQTCSGDIAESDGNGLGVEDEQSCILPKPSYPGCRNRVTVGDDGFGAQDDQICKRYPSCHGAAANPDKDNWGWENNARCVMHQTCSGNITNGDWGWEDNASCLVAAPYGPAYPNCSNGIALDQEGIGVENEQACFRYPTCSAPDKDFNGDGWGRENDELCIMHQNCSSSDLDPDGDNMGIENDEVCLVSQECSSTELDPDGDNLGIEFTKTCIISEDNNGITRPIGAVLSNPNSTPSTAALYEYLVSLPKGTTNRLLSGAFGGYTAITGEDVFSLNQSDDIFALTGERPAVYACDYARGWNKHETPAELVSYECNETLKDLYINHGSLVQISNHLPSPVPVDGGELKGTFTNEYYAQILEPENEIRVRWLSILDKVAEGLLDLQDAGVPVLFRPLHEMNGEWFWWGAETKDSSDEVRFELYKQLYIDMHNYYTETKQLNNLIWIFSPDARRGYKSNYYPGEEYVDIVGLDAYSSSPTEQFIRDGYAELLMLNKPFAFAEIGPDEVATGSYDYQAFIHAIRSYYPETIYFLAWNNTWSPVQNLNAQELFGHGWTVNLGEYTPPQTNQAIE